MIKDETEKHLALVQRATEDVLRCLLANREERIGRREVSDMITDRMDILEPDRPKYAPETVEVKRVRKA